MVLPISFAVRSPRRDLLSASFVPRVGRTGNGVSSLEPEGAWQRIVPILQSLISRIESRVPRDDWKRWVLSPRNSSSYYHSFFSPFFFLFFDCLDVDNSNNSNGHISHVVRQHADSFLRIFRRSRNHEKIDQKTQGERRK